MGRRRGGRNRRLRYSNLHEYREVSIMLCAFLKYYLFVRTGCKGSSDAQAMTIATHF